MDFNLVDFDKQFQDYLKTWMKECRDQYETIDEMEEDMPAVYGKWMLQPARWLNGATPAEYFYQYDDGIQLVDWMLHYLSSDVSVPDPLLDRISAMGKDVETPLLKVLRNEVSISPSCDRREVASMVINLLNEIESTAPMDDYIRIIASHEDCELSEVACDALAGMGSQIVDPILEALEQPMSQQAMEDFVDILSNYPGDKRIFKWLMKMFDESDMKALFASDLGKFGDEDALPVLIRAQTEPGITYLDYIEIRNAIEQLGGEPEEMRDFTGDPYYESLKGV